MTKLKGPIRREVTVPGIPRPVVIEIDPETKRLGFRERGARTTYYLPIMTAFSLAIRDTEGRKR